MTNILVIGGSYFAGRVFVEEALKRPGAIVHVFNRGRMPLRMAGVIEHVGDRDQPEAITAAVPPLDWDAVIDFCCYTPGQVSTLLARLPGKAMHYIFISTTSVYPPSTKLPIDETAELLTAPQPHLGDYANYGFDKARSERTVAEECDRRGIAYTIVRPAIIYGCYN